MTSVRTNDNSGAAATAETQQPRHRRRHRTAWFACALAVPFALVPTPWTPQAQAALDLTAADAVELRAAVQQVNDDAGTGPYTITLTTAGPYTLACGTGEDANVDGDLDIDMDPNTSSDDDLTITYAGTGRATIEVADGCAAERVIDIHDGQLVRLEHVVISGGDLGATRGGTSEGSGGGIRSVSVDLELDDVVVEGNHASDGIPGEIGFDARGGAGGGVLVSGARLDVVDSIIRDNRAGDGASESSGGDAEAGGPGGGLTSFNSTTTLTNTVISGNQAGDGGDGTATAAGAGGRGGGIYASGTGTLDIVGGRVGGPTTPEGNRAGNGGTWTAGASGDGGEGGGVFANTNLPVSIDGVEFANNSAGDGATNDDGFDAGRGGDGGGLDGRGPVIVAAAQFLDNRAGDGGDATSAGGGIGGGGGAGGAISVRGSAATLVMTDTTVIGNQAGRGGDSVATSAGNGGVGGGIRHMGPTASVSSSVVLQNSAGDGGLSTNGQGGVGADGGGVYFAIFAATPMDAEISESTIESNSAGLAGAGDTTPRNGYGGGARLIGSSGTALVTASTIADNAAESGGALYVDGSALQATVVNSTLSDNTATATGGAIEIVRGELTVVASTVASNDAPAGASIHVDEDTGSVTLARSVLAAAVGSDHCNRADKTADDGDNVEQDAAASSSCGVATSLADVGLAPLADNGGDTRTRLPALGGPLVDAVTNCVEPADQRGTTRPQGDDCDIGAVELELFINLIQDDVSGFGDELVVDVLANDVGRDFPIDPASVVVSAGPSNGTTDVDPGTGQVTYTPTGAFEGADQFFYSACLLGAGTGTPNPTCGQAVVDVDIDRPDREPAPFSFVDVTDVEPSTTQTSNSVTVDDVAAPTPISVVGGTYSVNGGGFTAADGTVDDGDQIRVRHTSAAGFEASVDTSLTVGGVSDTFTSTTAAIPVPDGASRFVSLSPDRLFDTRDGTGDVPVGKVPADGTLDVQVGGRLEVPVGAAAVVINLTVDQPDGPGFITAYPRGADRPLASTLNITAPGQVRPNLAIVPLDDDGFMSIYALTGMHVLGDVAGYFESVTEPVAAGRVLPLEPTRIFDSRPGEPANGPKGFIGADQTVSVQIAGEAGVPDTGVAAVVLNVTGTEAAGLGFVTVWPTGADRPLASSLNLEAGSTAANLVIVPLGDDGRVDFYSLAGAHLLADVTGYVTDGTASVDTAGMFVPVEPGRVFDTRPAEPAPGPKGFVTPGSSITVAATGVAGVPADAAAVVLNVTATEAPTGFITAWPTGGDLPLASTLNLQGAADTRANAAILPVGNDGGIDFFSLSGAHLLADTSGYFLS